MNQSAPQLPVDPNLAGEQQAAQNANISALQTQAQGDTASLMARYGTRLAMAQMAGGTGVAASAATSPLTGALSTIAGAR